MKFIAKILLITILFVPAMVLTVLAQTKTGMHILTDYPIKSSGGWDYITVDGAANRVYTSHGMQVNVLNAATGDSVGYIPDTKGVHGIAIAPDFNKGYTSNGRAN